MMWDTLYIIKIYFFCCRSLFFFMHLKIISEKINRFSFKNCKFSTFFVLFSVLSESAPIFCGVRKCWIPPPNLFEKSTTFWISNMVKTFFFFRKEGVRLRKTFSVMNIYWIIWQGLSGISLSLYLTYFLEKSTHNRFSKHISQL